MFPSCCSLRIAVVLPAYQAEEEVGQVFRRLETVRRQWSRHHFRFYGVDDGSTDHTEGEMRAWLRHLGLPGEVWRNERNQGLVPTLLTSYPRVLADREFQADWVVKQDVDGDYDPQEAIGTLLEGMAGERLVVGVRSRIIEWEENPYEASRRAHLFPLLARYLGRTDLDPASCGPQAYPRAVLQALLGHPRVQGYEARWGLDFLLPLLAMEEGCGIEVRPLPGSYQAERRPVAKVRAQYDQYLRLLAQLCERPEEELRFPEEAAALRIPALYSSSTERSTLRGNHSASQGAARAAARSAEYR